MSHVVDEMLEMRRQVSDERRHIVTRRRRISKNYKL